MELPLMLTTLSLSANLGGLSPHSWLPWRYRSGTPVSMPSSRGSCPSGLLEVESPFASEKRQSEGIVPVSELWSRPKYPPACEKASSEGIARQRVDAEVEYSASS